MAIEFYDNLKYGPRTVGSDIVLFYEQNNVKCWGRNVFPNPLDVFLHGTAHNCVLSRDFVQRSPVDGIAMKMVPTGTDPHQTIPLAGFGICPSGPNQTWTASCFIRASHPCEIELYIIGTWDVSFQAFVQRHTVTTEWQRYDFTQIFSNPSITDVTMRLDGPSTGLAEDGITTPTIWFDGAQLERGPLTAFSRFTNTNGEVLRDPVGNANFTLNNGVTIAEEDNSFSFTGNQFLSYADPGYPSLWSDPFSFEVVHRVPAGTDWHDTATHGGNTGSAIIGKGAYSNSIGLLRRDPNTISSFVRPASNLSLVDYPAQFDTTYHIIGTWDGTTNRLYVNGELIGSDSPVIAETPDTGNVHIGGNIAFGGLNGGYANGITYLARMYSKALTTEEIRDNFYAARAKYNL